jgi:predicted transcriptional regulator
MALFIKSKPCQIIILLRDTNQQWHAAKLASQAGASYIYTGSLLSKLEKGNYIVFERKGRAKFAKLTEKGVQLAALIDELVKKLEPRPAAPPAAASSEQKAQLAPKQ